MLGEEWIKGNIYREAYFLSISKTKNNISIYTTTSSHNQPNPISPTARIASNICSLTNIFLHAHYAILVKMITFEQY